jgi:hypothetical protein
MPLPGGPKVGDAMSTKKRIFEVKESRNSLKQRFTRRNTSNFGGTILKKKNNEEAAAVPQKTG